MAKVKDDGISVEEAVDVLQVLGCGSDPIRWHNQPEEEISLVDCVDDLDTECFAKATAYDISFWTRFGWPYRGTLLDMVIERLGCEPAMLMKLAKALSAKASRRSRK